MSLIALDDFLRRHSRLVVISGAGCSTPSGIGDYRDRDGEWKRAPPIHMQQFVQRHDARQRYWARSMHGWPSFAAAQPNAAHAALALLERRGALVGVITQNVDGLHQRAGQERLIELHGNLSRVVCLDCGAVVARTDLQAWLERENAFVLAGSASPAPDGDADLIGVSGLARFAVPQCTACGGVLKPDVVFYGDSVPRTTVAQAYDWVQTADALLIVGSSLMVYSSFRFARRAHELGLPMAALNLGRTRADHWLELKVDADCATTLAELVA